MTAGTVAEQETLRQIVRGERSLGELASIGITLRRDGESWRVENPRGISMVVGVHDLAKGIIAQLQDPTSLRRWAMFVYAADLNVDAENQPYGDEVLEALWDAAFGNPFKPSVLEILKQLSRE